MQRKIQKNILVSKIIAFETPELNCLYYEGNTCQGQSMR